MAQASGLAALLWAALPGRPASNFGAPMQWLWWRLSERSCRAAEDDYAATYKASALCGFATETRGGYVAELGLLVRTLRDSPGLRRASRFRTSSSIACANPDPTPGCAACSLPCGFGRS